MEHDITPINKWKQFKKTIPEDTPYIIKIQNNKIIYCKTDYQPLMDYIKNEK